MGTDDKVAGIWIAKIQSRWVSMSGADQAIMQSIGELAQSCGMLVTCGIGPADMKSFSLVDDSPQKNLMPRLRQAMLLAQRETVSLSKQIMLPHIQIVPSLLSNERRKSKRRRCEYSPNAVTRSAYDLRVSSNNKLLSYGLIKYILRCD